MSERSNRNKVKGKRFASTVYSDVKRELVDQAKMILTAQRFKSRLDSDKKIQILKGFFHKHPELNPLRNLDTYGVEQIINALAKDGKEATASKRLYQSMIDTYVKDLNEETMKKTEKVDSKKLVEMVNQSIDKYLNSTEKVNESIQSEILPGSDGDLGSFMKKIEDFIDETTEKAEELALEGEEMLKANLLKSGEVAERNRLILTSVGILRKLKFGIGSMMLDLRKSFG